MTSEPHPFSSFVAILGRGRSLTRSLTMEEAREAFAMVLDGAALPEQVGALLMLLRVKEEAPEEIAGFVQSVRARFRLPEPVPAVDLDWSSYAGKRRQLPFYILSALLLAGNGVKVFMHGTEEHTPGRVYSRDVLSRLGVPIATDFGEAALALERCNFAYMPLEALSPKLKELFALRAVLGLRSPVHTVARMLNPFRAAATLQGIFHPGYMAIHRDAALLLGERRMAVFRGEGGEAERRPNKPCEVWTANDGVGGVEVWPPLLDDPVQRRDAEMDLDRLAALWRGETDDDYGEAAITGTVAIALRVTGRAASQEDAGAAARAMWQRRDRTRVPGIA